MLTNDSSLITDCPNFNDWGELTQEFLLGNSNPNETFNPIIVNAVNTQLDSVNTQLDSPPPSDTPSLTDNLQPGDNTNKRKNDNSEEINKFPRIGSSQVSESSDNLSEFLSVNRNSEVELLNLSGIDLLRQTQLSSSISTTLSETEETGTIQGETPPEDPHIDPISQTLVDTPQPQSEVFRLWNFSGKLHQQNGKWYFQPKINNIKDITGKVKLFSCGYCPQIDNIANIRTHFVKECGKNLSQWCQEFIPLGAKICEKCKLPYNNIGTHTARCQGRRLSQLSSQIPTPTPIRSQDGYQNIFYEITGSDLESLGNFNDNNPPPFDSNLSVIHPTETEGRSQDNLTFSNNFVLGREEEIPPPPPYNQDNRTFEVKPSGQILWKEVNNMKTEFRATWIKIMEKVIEFPKEEKYTIALLDMPRWVKLEEGKSKAFWKRLQFPEGEAQWFNLIDTKEKSREFQTNNIGNRANNINSKRINELASNNQFQRALNTIISTASSTTIADHNDPIVLEKILDCFPRVQSIETVSPTNSPSRIRLDIEDTIEALSSLKIDSSSGYSGWTNDLLKGLCFKRGEPIEEACKLVNKLMELLVNGEIQEKRALCRSKLVPLKKDDGKVRPIAIGEVFYRLAGKILMRRVASKAQNLFKGTQFGVGIRNGAEIVANLCNAYIQTQEENPDNGVIGIDVSNAFNSINRKTVGEGICRTCPELIQFYNWSYGEESEIMTHDGILITMSQTGVKQGDPLGPLLFAVGLHDSLIKIKEAIGEEHAVCAYLDDISILGDTSKLNEIISQITPILNNIGLKINDSKTVSWCNAKGTEEGIEVLGVPIGGENYKVRRIKEKLNTYADGLSLIRNLEARTSYALIVQCINTKPNFLMRNTHPDLGVQLLKDFDKKVIEALANSLDLNIMGNKDNEWARRKAGLPLSSGGIGLHDHGLVRGAAWGASQGALWAYLGRNTDTDLAKLFLRNNESLKKLKNYFEDMKKHNNEDMMEDPTWGWIPRSATRLFEGCTAIPQGGSETQKNLTNKIHQEMREELITTWVQRGLEPLNPPDREISVEERRRNMAWFISGSEEHSSKWLSLPCLFDKHVGLQDEAFKMTLAMRIGWSMKILRSDQKLQCKKCNEVIDGCQACFHPISCRKNAGAIINRHDYVVDEVFKFINQNKEPYSTLEKEANIGNGLNRADITNHKEDGTNINLDIGCTNCTLKTALSNGSDKRPSVAAEQYETFKKAKAAQNAYEMIPLIFELTGRAPLNFEETLIKCTRKFPSRDSEKFTRKVNYLKKRLTKVLLSSNHRLITDHGSFFLVSSTTTSNVETQENDFDLDRRQTTIDEETRIRNLQTTRDATLIAEQRAINRRQLFNNPRFSQ